jgi:hypothetical protein
VPDPKFLSGRQRKDKTMAHRGLEAMQAVPPSELQLDVAQLAATHAALDPERREWRCDIVMTTVIALIADRGPMSCSQIVNAVNKLWRTSAITEPLISQGLEVAAGARLVVRRDDFTGTETWAATEAAERETKQDRERAALKFGEFERGLARRLEDNPAISFKADRVPKLASQLFEALATGAQGLYQLAVDDPNALRPIYFRDAAIFEWIDQNVEPASMREALREGRSPRWPIRRSCSTPAAWSTSLKKARSATRSSH